MCSRLLLCAPSFACSWHVGPHDLYAAKRQKGWVGSVAVDRKAYGAPGIAASLAAGRGGVDASGGCGPVAQSLEALISSVARSGLA